MKDLAPDWLVTMAPVSIRATSEVYMQLRGGVETKSGAGHAGLDGTLSICHNGLLRTYWWDKKSNIERAELLFLLC